MLSQSNLGAALGATQGLQNLLNQENIGDPSQRAAMASSLDRMACQGSDEQQTQNLATVGQLIVDAGGQNSPPASGGAQTSEWMQTMLLMMLLEGGMGGGMGMGMGGGINP